MTTNEREHEQHDDERALWGAAEQPAADTGEQTGAGS
jgi:hypothetical protein